MGDGTDNPKARLRRELEARRHAIAASGYVHEAAAACAVVVGSRLFQSARHVVLYAARPFELDPGAIELVAAAKRLPTYYPRVEADGLTFRRGRLEGLAAGRFGVREPAGDAVALDPGAPDVLVIVPGVAFDRRGGRLGTGRGYYDRALPALAHARCIGFTIEALIVDVLPSDPWDVPMHAVATERGFFFADRSAGADLGDQSWS
jgi:5-formyltetrahydrofolate cyclo-ligase